MKKITILLVSIIFCLKIFSQNEVYWKSIIDKTSIDKKFNKEFENIIGRKYVLLQDGFAKTYFTKVDLDNDGKKEIIVFLSDTTSDEAYGATFNKLFIFSTKIDKLILLDSSSKYETDGHGPTIEFKNNTLYIEHEFHRGHSKVAFKFNKITKKFNLISISFFCLMPFKKQSTLNIFWDYSKFYNVQQQTLTITGKKVNYETEKVIAIKQKIISKKLPKQFSLLLKSLQNPNDENEYSKILYVGEKIFKKIEF
jgi:hypothetical protein